MKKVSIYFAITLFLLVFIGCASNNKHADVNTNDAKKPEVVTGDFNGDGEKETVSLIKPKLNAEGTGCIDSTCTAIIRFSDTTIHSINVKNCIGGIPDNLGDLNGDGKDEIGILPDWFTSCWHDYLVFTYKDDEWVKAVPPIPTHCNQWENKVKPIEKDSLNKGYVVIRYSEFVNEEIVTKSKIVSIQ